MGSDTLISRSTPQHDDQSWFNIFQSALGGTLYPRGVSGAVSPGQDWGDSANFWANVFLQTGKLLANGNQLSVVARSDLAGNYTQIFGKTNSARSSSCGTFSTASTTYVDVTNLSKSITTTGGLILIQLVPNGSSTSYVALNSNGLSAASVAFLLGSTIIAEQDYSSTTNDYFGRCPIGAFCFWDDQPAGTYAYKVQIKTPDGQTISINNAELLLTELK